MLRLDGGWLLIMFILMDGMYCRLDRHCVIVGIVLVGYFYYIVYVYYLNLGIF